MTSELDFMKLCRLCLIKDGVKVPIFGNTNEVEQLFSKISSCLPVKVSQDDKLPKKICEPCLQKVDSLYQFWNTAANAEKQLLQWLEKVNVNMNAEENSSTQIDKPQEHSTTTNVVCKQECDAEIQDDSDSFQDNSFQVFDASYSPQPNTSTMTTNILRQRLLTSKSDTSSNSEEKNAKKTKEVQNNDSDDEMLGNRVAKQEVNSDEDYEESDQMLQPTAFVDVPCDADQPGPSGLNKTTAESGSLTSDIIQETIDISDDEEDIEDLICKRCGKKFPTRRQIVKHIRRHREPTYPCEICGKKFIEKYESLMHKELHAPEKKFTCDLCGLKCKTKDRLNYHKRRVHFKDFPYQCDQCDKGYFCKPELVSHKEFTHEGFRLSCDKCDKIFKARSQYNYHIQTHDPGFVKEKFICEICSKEFSLRATLRVHLKVHNGQMYVCDVCGKQVTSLSSLRHHKRTHSGEKPYTCTECSKTFSRRRNLIIHNRVHSKEKPYTCEICEKKFTQRSSLVVHKRYHSGERPYKCDICQKCFFTKTLMRSHLKVHGMPLSTKTAASEDDEQT